jgi:hypothetical protein
MHVHMIQHAGTGRFAEVDADVQAVWLIRLGDGDLGPLREHREFLQLGRFQRRQRGNVAVRDNHEVPVVIRIKVQHDVRGRAGMDDERF